jgi:hypothetical protein
VEEQALTASAAPARTVAAARVDFRMDCRVDFTDGFTDGFTDMAVPSLD